MAFEMFIIDVSVWLHSENSTGWQMKTNSINHVVNDKLDGCEVMKMLVWIVRSSFQTEVMLFLKYE